MTDQLHRVSGRAFWRALPDCPRRCVSALVLAALAQEPRRPYTAEELAEIVYADREDGGPLSAANGIRVLVGVLRRRGIRITSQITRGYYLSRPGEDDLSGRQSVRQQAARLSERQAA